MQEDDGTQKVSARLLHQFLGSGWRYADWFKQCRKDADLIKDEDYGVNLEIQKNPQGGRPTKDYWLTMVAKELSMLERKDQGKTVRPHGQYP